MSTTRNGSITTLGAILALVAGLLALSAPAGATPAEAPGTPVAPAVPTGNVIVDPGWHPDIGLPGRIAATLTQPDGKIIIGGNFEAVDGVRRLALARINADGSLDKAFNSGVGLTDTYPEGGEAPPFVSHLLATPTGQVVVIGSFTAFNGVARHNMLRLQANGALDAGFNAPADLANFDRVDSAALQPDGRLLLALPGPTGNTLVRLNADGTRDSGFAPPGVESADALIVQPDGRILVGGSTVMRPLATGTVDPTFTVIIPTGDYGGSGVSALALEPGGKVMVGGPFTALNYVAAPHLARINGNGSIDASFNVGTGPGDPEVGSHDPFDPSGLATNVTEVDLDAAGRVVVSGNFTTFNGAARKQVVRLDASGSVDPGFVYAPPTGPTAPAGRYPLDTTHDPIDPIQPSTRSWLAVQPDDLMLVSSSPLTKIGPSGTVGAWRSASVTSGNGADGEVLATAADAAGRIVIGGDFGRVNATAVTGIARLAPDGSTDPAFSAGAGIAQNWAYTHPCVDFLSVQAVAVLPDDRVMVGGAFTSIAGVPRAGIARLTVTGAVDAGFALPPSAEARVSSIVVQPDGKLLVGGLVRLAAAGPWYSLVRLNADGSPDAAFTPWNTGAEGDGSCLDFVRLALQRDGAMVTIGGGLGQITRLQANGLPDPTFVPGGGVEGTQSDVAVAADGRIVVAGEFNLADGAETTAVLRLSPTGTLDPSFSAPPFTMNMFGEDMPGWVERVLVAGDGRVLAAGLFDSVGGMPSVGLARLQPTGALDTSLASGASDNLPLIADIFAQPDGRIVIGGWIGGFTDAFPTPRNVTRLTVPMTPPTAPRNLAVTNGDAQAAVWFLPPASFGGAEVTTYEYSLSGGPWTPRAPGSTSSPVVIGGLADGATYWVRLRARNAAGAGAASAEVVAQPVAAPATVFTPVEPARVIDTRVGAGGAGPILGGQTRTVSVATKIGGGQVVPPGAVAVAYNLTVPNPANAGHVRVMPGDASGLTSASAINFRAGETIANAASVKIDANRSVKMYAGATTDVIVDVVGYFVPAGASVAIGATGGAAAVQQAVSPGLFTAVTPVRVYDAAADASGSLPAGATRTVSIATALAGGATVVPAGASAVAYNVTVVKPAGAGHLRVMPGDAASSATSVVNWTKAGEVIANAAVVRVDAQRRIRVFNGSGGPVRFLIDVVGYYSASGLAFYPIDPVRVTESRWLQGGAGPVPFGEAAARTAPLGTIPGTDFSVVPAGAAAVGYNLTAVNTGGSGHLRVYPADKPLVSASALNWPGAGYTRANASVVAVSGAREVKVYNGSGAPTDVVIDINGYYK